MDETFDNAIIDGINTSSMLSLRGHNRKISSIDTVNNIYRVDMPQGNIQQSLQVPHKQQWNRWSLTKINKMAEISVLFALHAIGYL